MPHITLTFILILLSMGSVLILGDIGWGVNVLLAGCYLVAAYLGGSSRVSQVFVLMIISIVTWWTQSHIDDFQYRQGVIDQLRVEEFRSVVIEGTVIRLLKQDEKYSSYLLHVSGVNNTLLCSTDTPSGDILYQKGCSRFKMQWKIPKNLTPGIGDVISFSSRVYIPQREDVAYSYWRMQGILGSVKANTWTVVHPGEVGPIMKFSSWLSDTMYDTYPHAHAQFLAGILLGERRSIDETTRDWFIRSGLMHIIAVSGFNVTIILGFMGGLLRPVPIWIRAPVILISLMLFVMIVGFQVPVVRATIMGAITYLLLVFGWKVRITFLLMMTFLVFILMNPFALIADMSLWLSFGSVLGIILTEPWWKSRLQSIPEVLQMREALIMTFASMIFTLPMSLSIFGQFSLISPVANMFAGVAIPPAMLFGFLGLFTEGIPVIGEYVTFIGWMFLEYILKVVELTGGLTWSAHIFEGKGVPLTISGAFFVVVYVVWLLQGRWLFSPNVQEST